MFRRVSLVTGILVIITFAGAVPLFNWAGPRNHVSYSVHEYLIFNNSTYCALNDGKVVNTAPNGEVNCFISYNVNGSSWNSGKAAFWYCMIHGGCW